MRRWSALKSFLIGAVPTALVFGVVAVTVQPDAPAERPEGPRTATGVAQRDALVPVPVAEIAISNQDDSEATDEQTLGDDELSWNDVATMALVDQTQSVETEPTDEMDATESELESEEAAIEEPIDTEGEEEEEEEEAEVQLAAQSGPSCGPVTCPEGFACCNASCGICTRPGERCSQTVCGMPMTPSSVSCGPTTCDVGELCCDPVCGRCISPGEQCVPEPCLSPIVIPNSEVCGMQTCNTGFVCCNPSCGICARPGEPCRQEPC